MDKRWIWKYGALAGIYSGIAFAVYEVVYWWIARSQPFWPLRMIAGIYYQTAPEDIAILPAIIMGALLHFAYSIVLGILVAAIIAAFPVFRRSVNNATVLGTVFGVVLYLMNFYILAFITNAIWFPLGTNPFSEIISHTIFYGTVMGLYLGYKAPEYQETQRRRDHIGKAKYSH